MSWIIAAIATVIFAWVMTRRSMKKSSLSVTKNNAQVLLDMFDKASKKSGMLPTEVKYASLIQEVFPSISTSRAVLSFAKMNSVSAGQKLSLRWVITGILVAQIRSQKNADPSQIEQHDILRKVSEVVPEEL